MKNLVFITSNFPFGTSEPFPGAEIPFLQKEFNKIIIISQNAHSEQKHILPPDIKVYRYNTSTSFTGFLNLPFLILKNLILITGLFKGETGFRKRSGLSLRLTQKRFLLKKIIKSIQLRDHIRSILSAENISSKIVLYSYWLNSGAHAIGMLDYPKSIKIARAHGSDLYEEKTTTGYLPLLRFVVENLDSVFFISENGKNYFSSKTGKGKSELIVSRLGVPKPVNTDNVPFSGNDYKIVSCSNLVPLKRINLIIEALKLIDEDKEIHWVHFGSGILRKELEQLADEILGKKKNIRFEFRGYVPVDEIFKYYSSSHIDLFLNTSFTEGVPVSIMEAQSFGIPVIATDVGGVSEIVTEGTGFLLPADFMPEELAARIIHFMKMNSAEKSILRERVLSNWNQKFNATVNYPEFISVVNRIFETSTKQII
jgi:glycosyltransferase involved in cell wall biosynthesis